MKKILYLLALVPFLISNAQTGSIKGKVIAPNNQPLEGVNIILIGTGFGAASDRDGNYEINNLPYGSYTLEVSLIGYSKRRFPNITINSARPKSIFITLSESAIETQQVIVSAGKYEQSVEDLPVSSAVIQPNIIEKNNYITFDEMLRHVSGVQINLEQPSIRGSSGYSKGTGARVLVAVNGIPLYAGDTGDIVWELIPMTDIERVEIIKGPASSLYGSSAIGGVINVITKAEPRSSVSHFRSYFGIYDKPAYDIWKWNKSPRSFYGAEFTHSGSAGNLGFTFSIKKFDDLSYRENDFSKKNLGYLKLNYKFSDRSSIMLFADYLNMNRGNFLWWKDSRNALVPEDSLNGNTVKSNRLLTGLIYHNSFSEDITAELRSSYYYTKFDGYGIELTTSTAQLFRNEIMLNAHLAEKTVLTTGVEASFSKVKSNMFMNPDFFGAGVYAQAEYKGMEKLIATAGLRFDYMKLDTINAANALTPKIGFNYKASAKFILRASFGTGFRAPTPAEVFTTTAVGSGVSIKGNPDLKSETNQTIEAGAIYKPLDNLSVDAAVYSTKYKNYIEPNITKEASIQFLNVPNASIQGFEIVSAFALPQYSLNLSAGYNYIWARDTDKKIALKYRPRHQLNLAANYEAYPFELGINFRFLSRVEEIDRIITEPPINLVKDGGLRVPVYVTDLSMGYNLFLGSAPVKIFINVKNLFNYNYVEFIGNLAPIRNFSLSTEVFF